MTVIAFLDVPTSPLLLSDMLLSRVRTATSGGGIFLPALGDIHLAERVVERALPFAASRMVRKPFIVSEHLHVAWAGDLSAGTTFRQSLLKLAQGSLRGKDLFRAALSTLDLEQQRTFAAIAVELPDAQAPLWRDHIQVYEHRCIAYDSPLWGRCYFGGSGGPDLQEWISKRDAHWSASLGEKPQLLAELLCAKLLFNETLLLAQQDNSRFSSLLESGCGGFYEASRFGPGGVCVPRNAAHLNLQRTSSGALSLTRLIIYSTSMPIANAGRVALVSSLIASPVAIELDGAHFRFSCDEVDVVMCPPFWSDEWPKDHIHVRTRQPVEVFGKSVIRFQVVTATIFEDGAQLPIEVIDGYDPDTQARILESSDAGRHQLFVELFDDNDPQVEIGIVNDTLWVQFSTALVNRIGDRFARSLGDNHLLT